MESYHQNTIQHVVSFSGRGLFSGKETAVTLHPAPEGHGIVFQRTDLPGKSTVPAHIDYVVEATRSTVLGKEFPLVQTVEHFLAAVHAFQIDNLLVEVSGPEIPIFDGSSLPFVLKLEEAGIQPQSADRQVLTLSAPLSISKGPIHMVALPSEECRISYTLDYPHSPYLRSQYYSYTLSADSFKTEIAPCRTFALYEEIAPLIKKGFFEGGGLANGVVIQGDKVLNPEGVRFPNEMVRHKILDVIGDLFLSGGFFKAHIIAICSGHAANHALAKEMNAAASLNFIQGDKA